MKKPFKILIIIQILISVIFALNITKIYAYESSNISLYYENCNNSVQIFNDAIEPFKVNNITRSANSNYNNNYAGTFIDENGILNIGYLQNQNIPSLGGQVQYVQMKFSYNYLLDIKNAISEKMIEYNINAVSIDEESNIVDVQVSNQDVANSIISYLNGLNLYVNDAINISINDDNIIPNSKTAYGGDKINDSILFFLNSYGTICMNVYDNETGKYGVLTNAHVAEANTTMYHNGSVFQGSKIGIATKRQHSGTIDAAFVPFENQNDWNVTAYAKSGDTTYNNIRLGNENLIIQGAPTRKLGQTSGNTTGTIERTNYDCKLMYDSVPTVIKNTIKYSNQSLGGDSGGPVYYDGGGQNLFLIAMNFARPSNPDSFTYGIGCNIFDVIDTFNITPILSGTIFNTTNIGSDEIRIDKLVPIIPLNPISDSVEFKIPSYINGRKVTEISNSAFANQINITKFVLPDMLESIGNSAFKGCSSLSSIIIPNTVINIDSKAFENCTGLSNITLSNSLFAIGTSAFKGCTNLSSVTLPISVQYIDDDAFRNCSSLSYVAVQKEASPITNLGQNVFTGCDSNLEINVPINRLIEYKNKEYWSSYRNKITSVGTFEEINIDCETSSSVNYNLQQGLNKCYKINVDCVK